ncbi:MAG: hypothetical protein ACRC0V_02645 [Fusobacteriaceae bacterium]
MKVKQVLVDEAINTFKSRYEKFIDEKLNDNMSFDEIEELSYEFIKEEEAKIFQTIIDHVDTRIEEDIIPCKCGGNMSRNQSNVPKKK